MCNDVEVHEHVFEPFYYGERCKVCSIVVYTSSEDALLTEWLLARLEFDENQLAPF